VIATLLFFLGVEAWKFGKRMFFRRRSPRGTAGLPLTEWDTNASSEAERGDIKDNEAQ
jgi:hypothetical protein